MVLGCTEPPTAKHGYRGCDQHGEEVDRVLADGGRVQYLVPVCAYYDCWAASAYCKSVTTPPYCRKHRVDCTALEETAAQPDEYEAHWDLLRNKKLVEEWLTPEYLRKHLGIMHALPDFRVEPESKFPLLNCDRNAGGCGKRLAWDDCMPLPLGKTLGSRRFVRDNPLRLTFVCKACKGDGGPCSRCQQRIGRPVQLQMSDGTACVGYTCDECARSRS
jgi:hypothetical protein